jgi:hypothetical protein
MSDGRLSTVGLTRVVARRHDQFRQSQLSMPQPSNAQAGIILRESLGAGCRLVREIPRPRS